MGQASNSLPCPAVGIGIPAPETKEGKAYAFPLLRSVLVGLIRSVVLDPYGPCFPSLGRELSVSRLGIGDPGPENQVVTIADFTSPGMPPGRLFSAYHVKNRSFDVVSVEKAPNFCIQLFVDHRYYWC